MKKKKIFSKKKRGNVIHSFQFAEKIKCKTQ